MNRMKIKFNGNSKNRVKPIDLRVKKIQFNSPLKINPIKKKSYKRKFNTKYKVNKTRQMNWGQLKQKFPGLSPYADADFDGLVNSRDCRPLDPSKDGIFSRVLGKVTGDKYGQSAAEYKTERATKKKERIEFKAQRKEGKALLKTHKQEARIKEEEQRVAEHVRVKGYAPSEQQMRRSILIKRLMKAKERIREKALKLSKEFKPQETVVGRVLSKVREPSGKEKKAIKKRRLKGVVRTVERFSGVRKEKVQPGKTAKGQKGVGAGRPKGSYKYTDPRTGQPVTAVQYHKLRKQLKRQAKTVETRTEVKQRFALAKRGLSPEEVAEAQEQMNARMARLRAIKEAKQTGQVYQEEDDIEAQAQSQEIPEAQAQAQAQEIPEAQEQVRESQIPTYGSKVPDRSGSYASPVTTSQHIEPMIAVPGSSEIPPGYRVQDDIMTGRKTLVALPQPEAWTR